MLGLATACSSGGSKGAIDAAAVRASVSDAGAALERSSDAAESRTARLPGLATPALAGLSGAYLSDVESCGACHPDAFAQQQASAHAFASFNNPIYRVAVETLRDEASADASLVCAGCHDAALLADGAMQSEIAADDPRAHNGVSCRLCHGIRSASRDGNGDFVLAAVPLPVPKDGDLASVARHKEAVALAPVSELCGSCHQSFLSPASGNSDVLLGQNELRSWADSAYTGQGASRIDSVEPADCVTCHMPKVPALLGDVAASEGRIASHQVLGGHTWLAAMRHSPKQEAEQRAVLATAVTVDVMDERQEGLEVTLDVVIRNIGVGHRFPGGVRDAANTGVRVVVQDASGRILLQSALGDEEHVLRSYVADALGRLRNVRETHTFAATIADHTVAPRDVAIVRYKGRLAKGQQAHTIHVELVHRSRSEAVAQAACGESRSRRGKAFANAAVLLGREPIDACVPQPTTVIAKTTRELGALGKPSFQRSYEHGLGLLHELQERVGAAMPSLQQALALAETDVQRAMALVALGQLASRQGRVDDALAYFEQAENAIPVHPAIAAGRGDAFAKVWRWPAAAAAYKSAVALAPGNASLWRRYALALGSAGQREEALQAARRGLELSPRNPDLLRVQALALEAAGEREEAMESYLANRGPDNRGTIIKRCIDRSAQCAREALPVHEHRLVTPRKRPKRN